MIKAYCNKKTFFLLGFLLSVCLFFLTSCGLDVLKEVFEDPVEVKNFPTLQSVDENKFFNFSTKKLSNANNLGHVYIYYKIYNKEGTHDTETSTLSGMSTDENKKASSASKMLENGYKELWIKPDATTKAGAEELALDNDNLSITIRLTDYTDVFKADISVGEKSLGIPCRLNGCSFNFFGNGEFDKKPIADDDDVGKNFDKDETTASEGFYVALFSVFMNYDDSYVPVYSPVHYLGSIKVSE